MDKNPSVLLKKLHPGIVGTVNITQLPDEHKKTLDLDAIRRRISSNDEKELPPKQDTPNARKRNHAAKDSDTCSQKKMKSGVGESELSEDQILQNKRDFNATLANIKMNNDLDQGEKSRWIKHIEANEKRLTNESEITRTSDVMFSVGADKFSGIDFMSVALQKQEYRRKKKNFPLRLFRLKVGNVTSTFMKN